MMTFHPTQIDVAIERHQVRVSGATRPRRLFARRNHRDRADERR
jgi:hypothetical protein